MKVIVWYEAVQFILSELMRSRANISEYQSDQREREGGEELLHNRLALLHIHPADDTAHYEHTRVSRVTHYYSIIINVFSTHRNNPTLICDTTIIIIIIIIIIVGHRCAYLDEHGGGAEYHADDEHVVRQLFRGHTRDVELLLLRCFFAAHSVLQSMV